jgi:HEPN domain-containing protein
MHEEWVKVSRDHLRAAELLLNEGLYHLVSFHAQRAAAQAMQATLDKNGVPAPHHGTMLELLSACEPCDPEAVSLRGSCALLDLYNTTGPGPTAAGMLPWGPPSYDQAEAALDAGRKIVQTLGRVNSRFALAAVA